MNLIVNFGSGDLLSRTELANSLENHLTSSTADIKVSRRREDFDSMDFGATLAIILGTASITALAEGIATWIKQRNGATVTIIVGSNVLKIESASLEEAQRIIELFLVKNG